MPHCSTQRATSLIVNVNSDSSYRRGGQEGQTWADVYFHLQRAFLVPNLQEFLVHGLTGLDVKFSSPQKNKLRPHEIFFDLARTDMKPKLGVLATDTRTTTRGMLIFFSCCSPCRQRAHYRRLIGKVDHQNYDIPLPIHIGWWSTDWPP
jgi:hypothetical protein